MPWQYTHQDDLLNLFSWSIMFDDLWWWYPSIIICRWLYAFMMGIKMIIIRIMIYYDILWWSVKHVIENDHGWSCLSHTWFYRTLQTFADGDRSPDMTNAFGGCMIGTAADPSCSSGLQMLTGVSASSCPIYIYIFSKKGAVANFTMIVCVIHNYILIFAGTSGDAHHGWRLASWVQ